uniref:chitin synthase n=1 Tax=Strigamia maritima TaxID=126957 RepID=T1J5I3_STRMM
MDENGYEDEIGQDQEEEPIYDSGRRETVELKRWDVFRVVPIKDSNDGEQKCLDLIIRSLKVVTYLLTFLLVLGCSVTAKATLLLMTSQISNTSRTYCKNVADRNHQYDSRITDPERVAWIWSVAFCFLIPEFFTFFRSARICVFKSYLKPKFLHLFTVALFETLHTVGISVLVFVVLPQMDSVKGAMITNCTCLVPAIFALFSRHSEEGKRPAKMFIDAVAIIGQFSGLVIWPYVLNNRTLSWSIPLSLFLVGFGWWENYVDVRSPFNCVRQLAVVKKTLSQTRYFTYAIISVWKIAIFFASMLGFLNFSGFPVGDLFTEFNKAFNTNRVSLLLKTAMQDSPNTDLQMPFNMPDLDDLPQINPNSPIYLFLIQVLASLLAYVVSKFTCRICIQGFSFAFPINLTIPVSISLLIAVCGIRSDDPCFLGNTIPRHLYWECPNNGDFFGSFLTREHNWVWLFWLLSQTWITLHIWTPKCERLASTEKLFVTPMYCGLLIDQSLGLNRRRDEESEVTTDEIGLESGEDAVYSTGTDYYEEIPSGSTASMPAGVPLPQGIVRNSDKITRIYACATMWHETKDEMIAMLKSVFRMDEDQSARRTAQKYLNVVDPDYYEFETHIFFDDAFEVSDDNDDDSVVNSFVKQLVNVMDTAASDVHQINIRIRPPVKCPAPYGGRLVWTLPGKTKLVAHLKDKSKIRHRKRWSQVMYMYYLLGHKLMEQNIHENRKDAIAENTYLLTLDGDIDFNPPAVQLLVDLMKKNRNLGAACGRIHPIGSGPMVWYQKFEYAIGHWLQKATEHMIGCVLCSPGCFSLFRAKGLMDNNVMARYTTQSDRARHYVQYDQGEDRWLCTLLLQRGYRVEYSAASDAYTQCPEGFDEFYNQRRRWVPSTMANILDLLMDSKRTIKVNDNISLPYIIYQGMLMAGTILGPGTIFLMLVGAFVAAFKIDNWSSFGANIVPILVFMIVCFLAKPAHQILLAQILSATYALIMMAVIVGVSLQMREDGIGSPSFIFLVALSGSFFVSALLHPQEFWCIVPGLIYYLSIPSMYLLLILYSLINLNIVSWGTREVQTKKTKKLLLSQLLTAFYALVMMAVIVGTLLQVQEDGWTSPGTLFLTAVTTSFIFTALLHPVEFTCVGHGWLYYLLVPSMYLLLIIYSGINLNVVTWGTREIAAKKSKEQRRLELAEEKKLAEEQKKNPMTNNQLLSLLGLKQGGMSMSNLCTCMMCTPTDPRDDKLIILTESINKLRHQIDKIETRLESQHGVHTGLPRRRSISRTSMRSTELTPLNEETNHDDEESSLSESETINSSSLEPQQKRDDLLNPAWIEDKNLKNGGVIYLNDQECTFWKELLAKYLFPIDDNPEQRQRIAKELIDLRNKSVFAFFMFNALFILIVFLLQLNKDNLYVEWPLGVKYNMTYNPDTHEVRVHKEYLHLEPIGLVFVFFFSLIIVIQFLAMLFHRFGTLSHILAATDLVCCSRKTEDTSNEAFINKNAVEIVRHMQKLKGTDDDSSEDGAADRLGRRKTIHNLEKQRKKGRAVGTLDVAFRKRFLSMTPESGVEATPILSGIRDLGIRRQTIIALKQRRDSVMQAEHRGSRSSMATLGVKNSFNQDRIKQLNKRRASQFLPNGNMRGMVNAGFDDDEENENPSPTTSHLSGSRIKIQVGMNTAAMKQFLSFDSKSLDAKMEQKCVKIFRPVIRQDEWKQIYRVIRRDGDLRQKEMFRLRKIEDQLKEEEDIVGAKLSSAVCCFRCGSSFSYFFRKPLICTQCQRVVCKRCVNSSSDGRGWFCNYCEKLRILQAQTNFFESATIPTSPQNLESDTELESDSGYDPTTHSLCSRESSLRHRKPLLGFFSQSEGGPSHVRPNGPDLPDENVDERSEEIRSHIETLVERIIDDNLENAKLQRLYDHSECLLIRQQRVALIVCSFQLALEQPPYSSPFGGGLYDRMLNTYQGRLSEALTQLGFSLHMAITNQPLTEGSTPTCAHTKLKEIVDEVLDEVIQLPCMEDCMSNSDILYPMENEWSDALYSQSYEDILATAVLNKVIEQHQRKNFSHISKRIEVESELVTPVTPETPSSLLTSLSPTTPSTDEKKIQTQRVQSDINEDESESDAGTESAGDDFSWADKNTLRPVSYTIEEQIEEITTTIEDSESETETTTIPEKSFSTENVTPPVVTKTTARVSGLPVLDLMYTELNFDSGQKVPFPELGVDVVDATDEEAEGQENNASILVSDVESWEDNWRFRKKASASPYGNVRGRIVVCDEPVPMLIPNPEDRLVRTRIGSTDIDELSDLSEKNSDDSLDASSTSDTDSELCFQDSPEMGKKKRTFDDNTTVLNDLNKETTTRLTPSPKPTPLPRKNKNLTTTDVPFVLHSPAKLSRSSSEPQSSIPEFIHQLQDVEIVEGNAAIFTCKVSGYPEPQMKWYLEGQELVPYSYVHMTNHGSGSWTLELLAVSMASSGSELMAVASNRLGQSTSSAYLNVVEAKKQPGVHSLTRRVNNTQDEVHVEAEKMLVSTNQLSELTRQLDNVDNTITRLEIQFQQRTWEERRAELQRDAIHVTTVEENASSSIRHVTGQALDVLSAAQDIIDVNKESFHGSIAEREHRKWLNPTGVIPNNPYSTENLVKRAESVKRGLSSVRASTQVPSIRVDDQFDGKSVDLSRVAERETDNTNTENETKEYRRDYFINGNSGREMHSNNVNVDSGTRNSLNVVEETMYVRAGKISCLDDKMADLESQVAKIEDTTSSRHVCDLEDKVVYASAQIRHNENQISLVENQVDKLQKTLQVNNLKRVQRSHSDRSSWQSHVPTSTDAESNRWTSLQSPAFRAGSLERLNVVDQKPLKSAHASLLSKKLSTSVSCLYRPPSTDNVHVSTRNVREEVPNLPSVKQMVSRYQEGLNTPTTNLNDQNPVMEARNVVILDKGSLTRGFTKREVTNVEENQETGSQSTVVQQLSQKFNLSDRDDKSSTSVKRVHSLTARSLSKEFREAALKTQTKPFRYPVTTADSDESLSPDSWLPNRPPVNFPHMNGNVNGEWGQTSPDTDGHGYTSDESGASTVSLPRYRLPVHTTVYNNNNSMH